MNDQSAFSVVNAIRPVMTRFCAYPSMLSIIAEKDRIHEEITNIVIHPHIMDYPRLIGKDGRFVKAFSNIVEVLGSVIGEEIKLILKDTPMKGNQGRASVVPVQPNYDINIPWTILYGILTLAGCENIKGSVTRTGEAIDMNVVVEPPTRNARPLLDEDFFDNLRTVFAGFGHFQGIGSLKVRIVQATGGGGCLERRTRIVLCSPEGQQE